MNCALQVKKIILFGFLAFTSDRGGNTVSAQTTGQCLAVPTNSISNCLEFERYRSYSGRCNNLQNPEQGAAKDVQQRILPAEYEDSSISSPRSKNQNGEDLPSTRTVSQEVHSSMDILDSSFTVMLMQWGQFIDHDLNLTPHKDSKQCEECSQNVTSGTCFPIKFKSVDSYFNETDDATCFKFGRSKPSSGENRNQINDLTSYLDGSMVYGSSESLMNLLREENSYRMKVLDHPDDGNRGLLPNKCDKSECSSVLGYCFQAGDIRVNEQPGLTAMHTILVREHNRIADSLASINPQWEVNKVFEETRRIIGAQIQHITYNEFLPEVLGPNRLIEFEVDLLTSGYYSGYDESCSAVPFNEFSTAAFRFGHSMIPPNFTLISEEAITDESLIRQLPLRENFFNPDILLSDLDDLLRGLTMVHMQPVDRFVTEELTNHLFENRTVSNSKTGLDLPSLNIQRGRDHGLPGYNKYREVCNLQKALTFADLNNKMTDDTIAKLQEVYSHPDDIDLYTGLLSETPQTEALTGPTLACIIGRQFKNLRKCDRYWYETSDLKIRFTQYQLKELRSSNLAALICKNMDKNSKFSRTPMKQVAVEELVDCEEDVKSINLEAWRETVLPTECTDYKTLTEKDRSVQHYSKWVNGISYRDVQGLNETLFKTSPSWDGEGWYRVEGEAGTRLAEEFPGINKCGVYRTMYMNAKHEDVEKYATKQVDFCYNYPSSCEVRKRGRITNCNGYFVYYLPNTGPQERYCSTCTP